MPDAAQWKLADLARVELDALAADGISFTPDDVMQLHCIAAEIETPESRMALARGAPVFVGRAVLWPLTMAATAWWERACAGTRRERRHGLLLAFAMSHCRQQDALDAIPPERAYKAAEAWTKRLAARPSEIWEAVRQVQAQDDADDGVVDPKEQASGMTGASLTAFLVAACGGDPAMWERQVSISYVRTQIRAVHAQQMAEYGGATAAHDVVRGTRRIGLAVEAIRARHAAGKGAV